MITENNKKVLNNIIANLSYDEYYKANFKNGKQYKKHRAYSLTDEILQAVELLKIANNQEITKDQEEEIKAFLLRYNLLFGEYLLSQEHYIKYKYKNSIV